MQSDDSMSWDRQGNAGKIDNGNYAILIMAPLWRHESSIEEYLAPFPLNILEPRESIAAD